VARSLDLSRGNCRYLRQFSVCIRDAFRWSHDASGPAASLRLTQFPGGPGLHVLGVGGIHPAVSHLEGSGPAGPYLREVRPPEVAGLFSHVGVFGGKVPPSFVVESSSGAPIRPTGQWLDSSGLVVLKKGTTFFRPVLVCPCGDGGLPRCCTWAGAGILGVLPPACLREARLRKVYGCPPSFLGCPWRGGSAMDGRGVRVKPWR
jgi:hypothetical protein